MKTLSSQRRLAFPAIGVTSCPSHVQAAPAAGAGVDPEVAALRVFSAGATKDGRHRARGEIAFIPGIKWVAPPRALPSLLAAPDLP